jgi:hypothetical protein
MGVEDFQKQIDEKGWYIFPEFINHGLVLRMMGDLEGAYIHCRQIQIENGLDRTEGTCHHILPLGSSFMDCLAEYERLDEYFTAYFGGKYILNSFGGNLLSKGMSYANDIHRDIRSFSGSLPLMLNTLLFLDDFTPENGATWLMNRGHWLADKPTEFSFKDRAFQITGKAGSVAVWNSNLWHRSGVNTTDKPRRSVTPELTRPFMKQGYDYTQFAEYDDTEWLKQILGYYSRTPETLQDWYRKPDERLYRSGQG